MKNPISNSKGSHKAKKIIDIKKNIKNKMSSIKRKHRLPTEVDNAMVLSPTVQPKVKKSLKTVKQKLSEETGEGRQDSHQETIAKLLPPQVLEEEEDTLDLGDDEAEDYSQMDKLVEKVTGKKRKTNFATTMDHSNTQVSGSKLYSTLSKRLESTKKKKDIKAESALPNNEQVKLRREIAYNREVEEVSKWQDIVEANREAPQMAFPLQQPDLRVQPESTHLSGSTPLEKKVAEILRKHKGGEEPSELEPEKIEAMDINTAVLRHKEVLQARALLAYQAAAAKRQRKIKSKKNRKFEKIRKLKEEARKIENLMRTDPEEAQRQLKEDADRKRIEERMSLKHKNTSKWAKMQKLRAKYDPEAREALDEQNMIGQQLTQKSYDQENIEEEEEDSEPEESPAKEEFNQGFLSSSTQPDKSLDKDKAIALLNQRLQEEGRKNVSGKGQDNQEVSQTDAPEKIISHSTIRTTTMDLDLEEDEEMDIPNPTEQKLKLLDPVFEDVQSKADFQKEKEEAAEKMALKDLDLYLPGWGSWTGPEIKDSSRKKRRFLFKAPKAPPRKDNKLSHVIINEVKTGATKHQVKEVPFPFKTIKQFESSIRQPIGREWCTENSLRDLTAPAIVTKKGVAINPISRDALSKV